MSVRKEDSDTPSPEKTRKQVFRLMDNVSFYHPYKDTKKKHLNQMLPVQILHPWKSPSPRANQGIDHTLEVVAFRKRMQRIFLVTLLNDKTVFDKRKNMFQAKGNICASKVSMIFRSIDLTIDYQYYRYYMVSISRYRYQYLRYCIANQKNSCAVWSSH